MGWREFRAWIRVMNGQREVEAGRAQTNPDSWDGQENDQWWAEMRAKGLAKRGR